MCRVKKSVVHTEEDGHDKHDYVTVMCMHACGRSRPRTLQFEFLIAYTPTSLVQGCLQWSCASLGSQAGLFNHHVLSEGSGLSGSSCAVSLHRTIWILLSSPKAPTRCPEDPDCPDPPVESRGWTQPLRAIRRIRTVRILLSSPEAGHSPYTASGGSGLSGSSCRVPRLDTAPTCCPEDPDCPDPPVESRGWTQPLHSVRRIRTVRILLSSPEAGHSPYMLSGGSGLSGSSCAVLRIAV